MGVGAGCRYHEEQSERESERVMRVACTTDIEELA